MQWLHPALILYAFFATRTSQEFRKKRLLPSVRKAVLLSTKTVKKEDVKCVLRKDSVSTKNAENDGALGASSILYDYFKLPKCDDDEEEARRIIQTAAKLIKRSIKALNSFTEYPGVQDLTTENAIAFLPGSLTLLLQVLFAGQNTEKKQASLGHAIIQATRPRGLIAPLQIGLAIQMHHHFGSKFLLDSLHQHGFAALTVKSKST